MRERYPCPGCDGPFGSHLSPPANLNDGNRCRASIYISERRVSTLPCRCACAWPSAVHVVALTLRPRAAPALPPFERPAGYGRRSAATGRGLAPHLRPRLFQLCRRAQLSQLAPSAKSAVKKIRDPKQRQLLAAGQARSSPKRKLGPYARYSPRAVQYCPGEATGAFERPAPRRAVKSRPSSSRPVFQQEKVTKRATP